MITELEQRLLDCEEALILMVQQYLDNELIVDNGKSAIIFRHDFMSAGEQACYYLVANDLAKWSNDKKYAIKFIK